LPEIVVRLTDFDYELPEELIALYPLPERSSSRLLCLNASNGHISHAKFTDLTNFLSPGDLLVCNNSRVIPARLLGQKPTGGRIEVLVERILNDKNILAYVRASKTPKPGTYIDFANGIRFEMLGRRGDLFELRSLAAQSVLDVIESIGHVPIPPYFQRASEELDKERYQTVYANPKGSVAAPTAGLHFDQALFEKLHANNINIDYVTLHVGAGTFAPVRVDDFTQHQMHSERIEVSAALCEKIKTTKANGGRVIAVGTTTARSLETASLSGELKPFSGETSIFIYPGFEFKCIDALITNFHIPCSTLMMLVAALGGYENIMAAYKEAVAQKYRFFSYGDAMLINSICAETPKKVN
jgi:S-adenosylmethionine:tRNA ribosyltransferase-isomerase